MKFNNPLEEEEKEIIFEKLKLDDDEDAPEFVPVKGSAFQSVKIFENILENMQTHSSRGRSIAGIMLAGDPGTGKTARINLLAKVLGVNIVTIEAPHIVEENIINIPYIALNTANDSKTTGSTRIEGENEINIIIADSHLLTTIKNLSTKITDKQHIKNIYKSRPDVIEVYEQLGGTKDELPEIIAELRKTYTVILFLDEILRKISPRIRNMLRGILDGRIGNDEIPKYVYPIYASNLEDEGIGKIPSNQQFNQIVLKNPSKEEWFTYFVNKYKKNNKGVYPFPTVKLNMDLINEFYHELEDNHISFISNSIRTSPRRWEQLLLYINSALPKAYTEQEARNLMTNVKTNFKLYTLRGSDPESHSKLADPVLELVAKLIKKTTGISVNINAVNLISDWRETLKHQIETKIDLGEARSYVPVISGLPGIGKTSQAIAIAREKNLRFIDINVSTLNPEDATGIALGKKTKDGGIETKFSLPVLYTGIMQKIKKADEDYVKEVKEEHPDNYKEILDNYKTQPFKYLILLDELNRNTPKVFNSIRRVLLEKNFGADEKDPTKMLQLPKECIMMAAINPTDEGVEELTKHMQDVLDIIETGPSWEKTLDHIAQDKTPDISQDAHDEAVKVLKLFVDKYKVDDQGAFKEEAAQIPHDEKPYFLKLGAKLLYVSPREYSNIVYAIEQALNNKFKVIKKIDFASMDKAKAKIEIQKYLTQLKDVIADRIDSGIGFIFSKNEMFVNDAFLETNRHWIMNEPKIDFSSLFSKDIVDIKQASFDSIFNKIFDGDDSTFDDTIFTNYLTKSNEGEIGATIRKTITDKIVDRKSLEKYVLDTIHPAKYFDEKTSKVTEDSNYKVSLLANLIRLVGIACYVNNLDNSYFVAFRKNCTGFISAIGVDSDKIPKRIYKQGTGQGEILDEFYGTSDAFLKKGQTLQELQDEIDEHTSGKGDEPGFYDIYNVDELIK
jgi:MoxR-like ATPase